MTRQIGMLVLALGLMAAVPVQPEAQAQSVTIGRGGIRYSGYGNGYYGGYGQGYTVYSSGAYNVYSPNTNNFSGYGNGPYWYGPEVTVQYPSNAGYGYGNGYGTYYNGYGYSGNVRQYYVPTYSPYGFAGQRAYRYSW